MAIRRALIIGIDEYPGSPLYGCVNDAEKLSTILSRNHNGTLNFQCEVITSPSSKITRPILRKAISDLFGQPGDVAFLHFSGHGTIEGIGGFIVTPDAEEYDVGISMSEILSMANDSQVGEIFITLDCCNSGAFGTIPEINNEKIILSEGISVITATRENQEALEEGGGGVFTSLLVEALEGGAAGLLGDVTAAGIYTYLDNALGAWDQRPMFKSNVSRFMHLRDATPKIDINLLRKILVHFPLPAEELELSPEYEPEVEPHDHIKELMFKELVKFRNAGLVEPIDEDNMYHAAINSRSCKLTTFGKYYWRLVNEGNI